MHLIGVVVNAIETERNRDRTISRKTSPPFLQILSLAFREAHFCSTQVPRTPERSRYCRISPSSTNRDNVAAPTRAFLMKFSPLSGNTLSNPRSSTASDTT